MIKMIEKRRHSELPSHFQHKFNLPHQDPSIAAAAAEGVRMGVEGAKKRPCKCPTVFLCLLGALLSVCVSLWMAMFSKDSLPRRISISVVAGVCALIFTLLANAAFKKRTRRAPVDDIEISQSILREHRKSMTNSLRKNTNNGDELIRQIRRHSSVIAIDHARQHLLQQQQQKQREMPKGHFLSAASPRTKRERASTSD
uniref:Transmembrane protein n=1 Tax=Globodera pallida TaxID=36090 RepID=A0A183BQ88_GLOPA